MHAANKGGQYTISTSDLLLHKTASNHSSPTHVDKHLLQNKSNEK